MFAHKQELRRSRRPKGPTAPPVTLLTVVGDAEVHPAIGVFGAESEPRLAEGRTAFKPPVARSRAVGGAFWPRQARSREEDSHGRVVHPFRSGAAWPEP